MMNEIKTIALAIAFFSPLAWAITYLFDGLRKQKSRLWLFALMLAAAFTYMMTYAKFMGHLNFYAAMFPLQAGIVLTLFPLLYLYVDSLTTERKEWRYFRIWHFAFPFAMTIVFVFFQKFMMQSDTELYFVKYLLGIVENNDKLFFVGKAIYDIGKIVFVLSSCVYAVLIVITLKRHYHRIREFFANTEGNELNWFRTLAVFFFAVVVFYLIIHLLKNQEIEHLSMLISVSYFIFGAFFWFLGLNGFRQSEVFNLFDVTQTDNFVFDARISKDEIEMYLINSKPYRNANVSVFDFCYHFQTNRTYMSDAISKGFGLNFRGLINQYRIREAVDVLDNALENKLHFELEEIAANVGFSSYSTFLRVFKSELGSTPTEYVKDKTSR
jgi:AraC-like DNA-binding protein